MRPIRIQIRGLTSFRGRVEVDFQDLGLFAISGPNGSGKSSVFDAMTFGLYGKAPRVADSVKELISLGMDEASALLEFTADGRVYRVTRTVFRSRPTKVIFEYLEGDDWGEYGEDSDKVRVANKQIAKVVGLDYEAFTRAVLLPQGRFAEFLAGEAKDRRTILIDLLGFELFGQMAIRAGAVAREAKADVDARSVLLGDEYAGVTMAAVDRARQDVKDATATLEEVKNIGRAVDELVTEWEGLSQKAEAVAGLKTEVVDIIGDLKTHSINATSVTQESVRAKEALETNSKRLKVAETECSKLSKELERLHARWGSDAAVGALVDHAERLVGANSDLEDAKASLETAKSDHHALSKTLAEQATGLEVARRRANEATDTLRNARAARDEAHSEHLAASLTTDVHKGDPCPICGQLLEYEPRFSQTALKKVEKLLRAAQRDETQARSEVETSIELLSETKTELGRISGMVESLEKSMDSLKTKTQKQSGELREAFGGRLPKDPLAEAQSRANRLSELASELNDADSARSELRKAVEVDQAGVARLTSTMEQIRANVAGMKLDRLVLRCGRALPDSLDQLEPPGMVPETDGMMPAYLHATARQLDNVAAALSAYQVDRLSGESTFVTKIRKVIPKNYKVRGRSVDTLKEGLGVVLQQYLTKVGLTEAELKSLRGRLKRKGALLEQIAEATATNALYDELAKELRANNLIKFLLDEALRTLAAAAADRLEFLSDNRYRLTYRGNEFFVVDHWNADEERPARTLSGGESFLASLALALALSDEIQGLSLSGSVKLESLFLDEGFGTLDPETLETVVSALDQLGSEGRMVGVITHISELANQLPAKLEVTKSQAGSRVDRSDRTMIAAGTPD